MSIHHAFFLTECSTSRRSGLVVTSIPNYEVEGVFQCVKRIKNLLAYNNGTVVDEVKTSCQADAKWAGVDDVKCIKGLFVVYVKINFKKTVVLFTDRSNKTS